MTHFNDRNHEGITPGDECHRIRARLPGYTTEAVLGRNPEQAYSDVPTHIAYCPACREEAHELMEMLTAAYNGQIAPATVYPPLDLSFLPTVTTAQPWFVDERSRLVVLFSDALLSLTRRSALAGAMRSRAAHARELLYRYKQEPNSVDNLDVTIEVFADDSTHTVGHINIGVYVPSRSPFDQAGSHVTLRVGEAIWQGETDDLGSIDFYAIPLASLARLRVEIDPSGRTEAP